MSTDAVNGGQFSVGYAINDNLNIEGVFSFANAKGGDQELTGLGIDLQHVYRRAERFSPYLHAGLGWMEVNPAGSGPTNDSGMFSGGAGSTSTCSIRTSHFAASIATGWKAQATGI